LVTPDLVGGLTSVAGFSAALGVRSYREHRE